MSLISKIKAMSWKAKILSVLGILLMVVLLTNCKLIGYGITQGLGQLRMVRNAVPIDTLLNDPSYPDSLKQKLLYIKEIRQFAIDSIHLKDSENYNAVYDLKGQPTAYVVQACEKYAMKKYLWKFPVVGKLPYKGFFDKADAEKEAERLQQEGYDTRIVNPGGWSTMGWFNDPILSSMLRKDEANLAELIIHELTHSTIFVKDNSELNENIADYVGENGAVLYLKSKYGAESPLITRYKNSIEDNLTLANYFLQSAKGLDSLYCTEGFKNLPDSLKDIEKQRFIASIIEGVDSVGFKAFDPTKIKKNTLRNVNNTFFTGYMTYYNKKDTLREQCFNQFGGDFLRHLQYLKEEYGR